MRAREIYDLRLASQEAYGDAYFDDPTAQQSLLFEKHGDVIFDKAGGLNLEYRYPSALSTGLFYEGSHQAGEIGVILGLLRQIAEPVVIDVGAQFGVHVVAWATAIPELRAFAFEPIPANRGLLDRNLTHHGLRERVTVEPVAMGAASGTMLLGAFGTRVVSVDDYVASTGFERLDLIRVNAGGAEGDVLSGARKTLETFRPSLFISLSTAQGRNDPDRTVAALIEDGYQAYLINDGIVTKYEAHDDHFANYVFVHKERPLAIPRTDLHQARQSIAVYLDAIRAERSRSGRCREAAVQKEAEIKRMKQAADERLDLINRLDAAIKGEQEKDHGARFLQATQLAEGRLRVIEALRAENSEILDRCADLQAASDLQDKRVAALQTRLDELSVLENQPRIDVDDLLQKMQRKEEVIDGLKTTIADQRELIDRLQRAAIERLDLIGRFDAHVAYLRNQLEYLNGETEAQRAAVKERDLQISKLRTMLESVQMDASSKDLLIGKLDEFVRSHRSEADEMRRVADERLGVIEQLDELARERLEVIRLLNERMHAQ